MVVEAVTREPVSDAIPCQQGKIQGILQFQGTKSQFLCKKLLCRSDLSEDSLRKLIGKRREITGIANPRTGKFNSTMVSVHFLHACLL